jgi:HAD superfamily hydrolase (TIGR01509 family)
LISLIVTTDQPGAMIKVIVIDLGGVLFAEGKSIAIDKLSREYGYDRDLVRKILSSGQSMDLRKGLISDETFWNWVQKQIPQGYDAATIAKQWYDGYVLDQEVLALIKALKGKYRLVAFSGNIRSRVQYLDQKYRFRKTFDLEIYSFDYHLTKPEGEFVEVMLRSVGCEPHEIVYVDDNQDYARPAADRGVNVVIYSTGEIDKLRIELRRLGVVW